MQITKIEIENFKFHHKLDDFNINNKNCLIYGENGTGKSSIYEALKANLKTNIDTDVVDLFSNRDYRGEDLKVDIKFNEFMYVNRLQNTLDDEVELTYQTIYMANEYNLNNLIKKDFYDVIENYLVHHFSEIKKLSTIYNMLEIEIHRNKNESIEEKYKRIYIADDKFKIEFKEIISVDEINEIIKYLKEDFEIEFEISNSKYEDNKLTLPNIRLKIKNIDDNNDFKNHFNEAKRKIISIAIFFALAKKYENKDSELKLLVLDDFLTSLDMSNRKLIFQYILDNFKEYQKIVLTHNIQFFNLIKKLVKLKDETWDIKHLFTIKENSKEIAVLKEEGNSYIKDAKEYLENGEKYNLQIAGSFLRREFERIIHEFERALEIGKVEEIRLIIDSIKKDNKHFFNKPNETLNNFINIINRLDSSSKTPDEKIEILLNERNKISDYCVNSEDGLYAIIQKIEFYKNILMNPTSHNDLEIEIYKKECFNTIDLLKSLDKKLKQLTKG